MTSKPAPSSAPKAVCSDDEAEVTLGLPSESIDRDVECPNLTIAIGASAGGFKEIVNIVERLPEHIQATIIVATHRQPDQENMLAQILGHHAKCQVLEPFNDQELECTTIYVGAPDEKVQIEGCHFDIEEATTNRDRRNRINDLFESVAASAGENSVGVILSGMLWDGSEGLAAISAAGGTCIVQDPDDANFSAMPQSAMEAVQVDFVGSSEEIANRLIEIASKRRCQN